ncbi:adhesion G protein-coupled receptor F5-like [Salarias fasciatus]|uniref:adhesion G protein-coupled receptor F5-like n=1 Tax=Salarias fasciatus TaxID=181472 RepID=UPI0011770A4F|nr:adhesion G protein-coupled receptor F5-like [Salarias fasciatus]
MAIFKNVWITLAVEILVVLGKVTLDEHSSRLALQESHESPWLPHTRQRRNALPSHEEYEVDLELNLTDISTLDQIRSFLHSINGSLSLRSDVNVTHLEITTVCSPNGSDFQCRCEDTFSWSREDCLTYGACSDIVSDSCSCISSLPSDGPYCEPRQTPAVVYEYQILLEVNTTSLSELRNSINLIFPLQINSSVNVSAAVVTTVCSPSSDGFQCRCEEEYRWSCDQCETYQSCDNVTDSTCGCISGIPAGGPFCLSEAEHDFTECHTTTPTTATPTSTSTPTTQTATPTSTNTNINVNTNNTNSNTNINVNTNNSNTNINPTTATTATPTSTTTETTNPPDFQEYLVFFELKLTDGRLVQRVRDRLRESSPFISHSFQISSINTSTVCSPSGGDFQCVCEDRYRWSCEQCERYESCDNDTVYGDTCGCVSRIPPDGAFCRSVEEHNFTECSITTAAPTTDSTSAAPTNMSTTGTSPETNATTVSTTGESTTTVPETTNATTVSTTRESTTVTAAPTTNSTTVSTTGVNSTTAPPPRTNATTISTTGESTTVTAAPTTNSTTFSTTGVNSTTAPPPTTNATTVSTTGESTTVTAAPTTKSTTVSTAGVNSTTAPPPPLTNATTVSTTGESTTVTPAPTTITPSTRPTTLTTPKVPVTPSTKVTTTTTPEAPVTPSTSPTTPTTPEPPVTTLTMSVRLDLNYTDDLANTESDRYIQLSTDLNGVFREEYQSITGFRGVFVTGFGPGSVIVDFSIQTTAFLADEIRNINENLGRALARIAPVIGSVVAQYNSGNPINKPATTFTSQDMTLTCGPPEVDVGRISDSQWKLDGSEIMDGRRQIVLDNNISTLTVTNVIRADDGDYECTLRGETFNYFQRGLVPSSAIRSAPIVRLRDMINIECEVGQRQSLECCVQPPFEVIWRGNDGVLESEPAAEAGCIRSDYTVESCAQPEVTETFTCQVVGREEEFSSTTTLTIFNTGGVCNDGVYGQGRLGDRASARCAPNQKGTRTAVCRETGWEVEEDTCILTQINELLINSEDLTEEEVPEFTEQLSEAVQNATDEISQSPATIDAVVQILNTIANTAVVVSEDVTENVLEIVDGIIGDNARDSWGFLNTNETRNTSSGLLGSLETLTDRVDGFFAIETPLILFNRTAFNDSFMANLNSSVSVNIPASDNSNVNITTITFPTLNNVMPARNSSFEFSSFSSFSSSNDTNETAIAINAAVVLIKISNTVPNVTLSYQKLNTSLEEDPQCVFWNFTLFNSLGAWDDQGCELVSQINDTVTCTCNHLTSFSILMSTNIPEEIRVLLDVITYVGVGISMGSLVICLIIEGYVWKEITRNSTAFMRHVSIINTALSLLIANICFIIAAAIADNESENPGEDHTVPVGPCSTATFFMHFFYLAVFFWMLVSGLLLLYRTVMIFSQMSKSTMLAIGFTLGYVCPLLTAVITIAVTAPGRGYIRKDLACWLNWRETGALLAMVIPALVIVLINFIIVIIVLFKMLRRGVGSTAQPGDKNSLVVIIRCLVILTPLFGLTWGLGVGTMISPSNRGIHIAFAFFNSFQGFFILVFGTLLDSKIRALLSKQRPAVSSGSHPTQSTSRGISSLTGSNFLNRFRRNRNIYRVSEATNSNVNSSSASETFIHS